MKVLYARYTRCLHHCRKLLNYSFMQTPEKKQKHAEYPLVRKLTVGTIIKTPGLDGKQVPYIRLSGDWLKKCGFRAEGRITVSTTHKQLIIRME